MAVELEVGQSFVASIVPTTKSGTVAKIDGLPTWEVAGDGVAVKVAADGMSAEVFAVTPGGCLVEAAVDADLGSGVRQIRAGFAVLVKDEEAAELQLEIGEVRKAESTGGSKIGGKDGESRLGPDGGDSASPVKVPEGDRGRKG